MKKTIVLTLTLLFTISFSGTINASDFPRGPELSITPGKICDHPSSYRYPEQIPYCVRDVTYQTKEVIIKEYDQKFNYRIEYLNRTDFKIDHFIPLCAGGSNDIVNLWPQHRSVYEITDPLEPIICAKMALGKLKQKEAIALITEAKTNLSRTAQIIQYVSGL